MKCVECGHENRAGTLICDNCGSDIYDLLVSEAETKELARDAANELRLSEPPSSRPLMLYVADGSAPLSIERKNNLIVGRGDPARSNNYDIDVDLSNFNAQEHGVSRQHAKINAREDPPILVDLGSSNGTFVNGERLEAESPKTLMSGDEVQLGHLKMRIYFK